MLRSLAVFLTPAGAFALAALDTSLLFFVPFGIDAVIVYLVARDEQRFWLYPLLATAGSLTGAAITFWIGHKLGDVGIERLVHSRRLERMRGRVRRGGAAALALPAIFPPPFPLTPFLLTCGALAVDRRWFFSAFGALRLLRFGLEAMLARVYGPSVLRIVESPAFQTLVVAFIIIAVIGSVISAIVLWRNTHRRPAAA